MSEIDVDLNELLVCNTCEALVPGQLSEGHAAWHGGDGMNDEDGWDWLARRLRDQRNERMWKRLERYMATITEALDALAAQVGAASDAQRAAFSNLQTAVEELRRGDLSPEQEAQVGAIEQSLEQIRSEAEAADDGVQPAPEAPVADEPVGPATP